MNQKEGIVSTFNGYFGKVISEDVEYVLTDDNISNEEIIKESDVVTFIPDNNRGIDIARFVKKKTKNNFLKK